MLSKSPFFSFSKTSRYLSKKTFNKYPKQNVIAKVVNKPNNQINWQTVIVSVSITLAIYSILKSFTSSNIENSNNVTVKDNDFSINQTVEGNDFSVSSTVQMANVTLLESNEEIEAMKPVQSNIDLYALGGNREIINNIADIVLYLQDPEGFEKRNAKPPKGVLLYGSPGVGKSLIAKAIAGHAGVPIIVINAAELQDSYVGGTERKIRQLFENANKAAPCVLCIDEIDALANKRVAVVRSNDAYVNGVVDQLLKSLEDENPGVVVIGTTNNYKDIDPAIKRPGRLSKHIFVPMPDLQSRSQILAVHTKGKKLDSKVSLDVLSSLCSGYSGAKIAAWVEEAALIASREKSNSITMHHFDEALLIVEVGPKKENINPIQKQRTAAHEAGHALVGHLLDEHIYKVSTNQYGDTRGHTFFIDDDNSINLTKEKIHDQICRLLAGRAAEQVLGIIQVGSHSDLERAKKLAEIIVSLEGMGSTISGVGAEFDIEKILQKEMQRATDLINDNHITWERLRNALVENDELNREEFLTVFAGKNIENNNTWWPWNDNQPGPQKQSELPPKKEYGLSFANGYFKSKQKVNIVEKFPFDENEIAKALGVPVEKIRSISRDSRGELVIRFKPSFDNYDEYERIGRMLKRNDVENWSFSSDRRVEIQSQGYEDFVKFVNKENNKTSSPRFGE